MRRFKDGDTVVIEPWRATGVPGDPKDLVVDRTAFDQDHPVRRLHQRQHRLGAPEANLTPDPQERIGHRVRCRRPASAAGPASRPARTPPRSLFVSAKARSPRPRAPGRSPSSRRRVRTMVHHHGRGGLREPARTRTTAKPRVRRRSASRSSRSCTATIARASSRGAEPRFARARRAQSGRAPGAHAFAPWGFREMDTGRLRPSCDGGLARGCRFR